MQQHCTVAPSTHNDQAFLKEQPDSIFLSIVIPVYNVASYLDETMASILPQLDSVPGGCEVLLVDDGSTDQSGALCDHYAALEPRIRVFHKENEGLLLTRRFGFRQAAGQYILNCDSDDTLEPDALKTVCDCAEKSGADVVLYNANIWIETEKTPLSIHLFHDGPVPADSVRRAMFTEDGLVTMCGKLIRRSCLDLDKDYSQHYKKSTGEDTLQSIEIYSRADSYYYCDQLLYNYRMGSGMTGKASLTYFADFMPIYQVLEQCKACWQLPDFDELMAKKIFATASRAITQSRYDRQMSYQTRKQLLQGIVSHPMFQAYAPFYPRIAPSLKRSYRFLLGHLLKGHMRTVHWMLQLKNLLSR